jgi:hypothetical protein
VAAAYSHRRQPVVQDSKITISRETAAGTREHVLNIVRTKTLRKQGLVHVHH